MSSLRSCHPNRNWNCDVDYYNWFRGANEFERRRQCFAVRKATSVSIEKG
jgi:hypothetical protein